MDRADAEPAASIDEPDAPTAAAVVEAARRLDAADQLDVDDLFEDPSPRRPSTRRSIPAWPTSPRLRRRHHPRRRVLPRRGVAAGGAGADPLPPAPVSRSASPSGGSPATPPSRANRASLSEQRGGDDLGDPLGHQLVARGVEVDAVTAVVGRRERAVGCGEPWPQVDGVDPEPAEDGVPAVLQALALGRSELRRLGGGDPDLDACVRRGAGDPVEVGQQLTDP